MHFSRILIIFLSFQQANRSSIPFQQPVDPNEVPNYYKVIKEPMGKIFFVEFFYWWIFLLLTWDFFCLADLSSVERKVNNGQYTKLCEFIGDVMRIFENCRFFNQPNTSIMKSAQSLEAFFSQKLSQLREKVAASWTNSTPYQSKKKNPLCTKCV